MTKPVDADELLSKIAAQTESARTSSICPVARICVSSGRFGRRIASADRTASAGRRLAFKAGGMSWLVALPDAGEVLPVPTLTSVPLTRSWVRGMANVRGNLYTVTDLAAFAGASPASQLRVTACCSWGNVTPLTPRCSWIPFLDCAT